MKVSVDTSSSEKQTHNNKAGKAEIKCMLGNRFLMTCPTGPADSETRFSDSNQLASGRLEIMVRLAFRSETRLSTN